TFTAILLISSVALADDPNSIVTPAVLSNGFYVEPYLGYGYVSTPENTLENTQRHHGGSPGLCLGYKFTDHWAVDAGYTQFFHVNVSTYYFYTSLKYIFPIHPDWDVFVKLGPTYLPNTGNLALLVDAGFTYWMSQNLGFVIQSAVTTRNN